MWYYDAIVYVRLLWFNKNHKFERQSYALQNDPNCLTAWLAEVCIDLPFLTASQKGRQRCDKK
jgi:hypothetical protein